MTESREPLGPEFATVPVISLGDPWLGTTIVTGLGVEPPGFVLSSEAPGKAIEIPEGGEASEQVLLSACTKDCCAPLVGTLTADG